MEYLLLSPQSVSTPDIKKFNILSMCGHTSKIHFWSVEPVKLMVIILTVEGSMRPIMKTLPTETDISEDYINKSCHYNITATVTN